VVRRAHLEEAAARGNPHAIAALAGPEFPEALHYLWERFERLDAMREAGFHGPARFSPPFLDAAGRLLGWRLAPHEVEALMLLDAVTLYPEPPAHEPEARVEALWPERKP
jgi:hypothetical protein